MEHSLEFFICGIHRETALHDLFDLDVIEALTIWWFFSCTAFRIFLKSCWLLIFFLSSSTRSSLAWFAMDFFEFALFLFATKLWAVLNVCTSLGIFISSVESFFWKLYLSKCLGELGMWLLTLSAAFLAKELSIGTLFVVLAILKDSSLLLYKEFMSDSDVFPRGLFLA